MAADRRRLHELLGQDLAELRKNRHPFFLRRANAGLTAGRSYGIQAFTSV